MEFEAFLEQLKGKRLLIVEDDEIQLSHYSKTAQSLLSCESASCYEEAVAKVKGEVFDFLITDIHLTSLPNDNAEGLQLISLVRSFSDTTVVIGMSTDESIDSSSMHHFVPKPLMTSKDFERALYSGYRGKHV
ncbi:response regulator [Pseudobacteriovorax antillogorgiicola]|uniref:Response regulator receiver domain-containing protein n=1 Tax=Pseudobacteriovorax antillogorgiicola TaxID=1513793 RepID=A0A1Y6BBZ7_9BACT|nr:response regulator [Pseudobacteriovorax antillogorgiicola]TCS58738.1 response regulator receiver domain-containing protein [Pseudobacteriovorax antillogorgiicola]SME95258.1 Response regulator receiver domain-containing protein [Pseudobacteriovorax antillogorgiicola]